MATDQQHLITKANALIEANYKLGVLEQKIILLLASKIQPNDSEFNTYSLSVKEFVNLLDLNSKSKYQELREITMGLMRKAFQVRIKNKVIQVSWLSYVAYNENEGTVDLRFDPFLKPYLLELKSQFTSYKLANIIKLKSAYSIRIYELLKQYERIKERTFSIDKLRELLELTDMYPAYANFKQRVIIRAQKELKEKTDLLFTFEEIKDGRKVDKIKFTIMKNPDFNHEEQLSFFNESVIIDGYDEIQQLVTQYGIEVPPKMIAKWLSYGKEEVLGTIEHVMTNKKVDNPGAYITSVLENGYLNVQQQQQSENSTNVDEIVQDELNKVKQDRGVMPKWLMRDTLLKRLVAEAGISEEEAAEIWEEYVQQFTDASKHL